MIKIVNGNLFNSGCDAFVNTVNTVGVMGKGIALEFKNRYPENYERYREACKNRQIQIGFMFVTQPPKSFTPKYIINFPTKRHWREPSRLSFIDIGMRDLVYIIKKYELKSLAIPALGCTNGGLEWTEVMKVVFKHLDPIKDDLYIEFYQPQN